MKTYSRDIFISYNSFDEKFATKLANRIEKEKVNGRKLTTWYAPLDIEGGDNIVVKIEEGLQQSKYIGIVMSPEWERSPWTELERTIAIYNDPSNMSGRIIPILISDCNIPPTLRILKWFDFRSDKNFEQEAKKIIAKLSGKRLKREDANVSDPGIQHSVFPDKQEELLVTNLFPVTKLPKIVYSTRVNIDERSKIWSQIPDSDPAPFAGPSKSCPHIFTFYNPKNTTDLNSILADNPQKLNINEFILSNPNDLVDLINRCMTRHIKTLNLEYDYRKNIKKIFFAPKNNSTELKIKKVKWHAGTRTVFRLIPDTHPYYAHQSCKASFTILARKLFLQIVPSWHFTSNGYEPVDSTRMNSLTSIWMSREKNRSILNHVRFWSDIFANNLDHISLYAGTINKIIVSSHPVLTKIECGIEGDYTDRIWTDVQLKDNSDVELVEAYNSS